MAKLWTVELHRKVMKGLTRLPAPVRNALSALTKDIEINGPVRGNWRNYSSLGGNRHHCHLKRGKTTYVAVWEIVDKKIRFVEVIYAGNHENAPY